MDNIFNMMNNQGMANMDPFSMLVNRFGTIQNAMNQLNGLMGRRGMDPRQSAINELRGKHFSEETINQFRDLAHKSGMKDDVIDAALKEAGII